MKLWIQEVLSVTASVRYRSPLYAGQRNSKYEGRFLESCSVTVIHTATAIYRAVTCYIHEEIKSILE